MLTHAFTVPGLWLFLQLNKIAFKLVHVSQRVIALVPSLHQM